MASLRAERKSFSSSRLPDLRPPNSARASVFSNLSTALRRTETNSDDMPAHHKSVLVTLKLSSLSFLDSVVKDDASRDPLYVIRTKGTSTSVHRNDPWDGLTKTAEIKWPKVIPTKGKTKETLGVLVQMSDGRWQSGDTILKPGTMLSAPPKFTIPNFPHSMKWKRVGSAYWCTTSSVKGPIATFHPAVEGVPPRIKVYETLHDKYDSRPILVHNGVSVLLIDHLIITAMLLVTDVQDWMLVQKYEGDDVAPPVLPPLASTSTDLFDTPPQSAPASNSQWRKILYGEPIFPKRYPNSRSVSTTDLSRAAPRIPSSPVTSLWDSEDEDDEEGDDDDQAYRAQRGSANSSLPSPAMPPDSTRRKPVFRLDLLPQRTAPIAWLHRSLVLWRGCAPGAANPRAIRFLRVDIESRDNPAGLRTPADAARVAPPADVDFRVVIPVSTRAPLAVDAPARGPRSFLRPAPLRALVPRQPSVFLLLRRSTRSSPPMTPTRTLTRSQSMKLRPQRQLPTPPTPTEEQSSLSRSNTRSTRRSSQYSQRSLPMPPDPTDEQLWDGGYSWTSNGAGPLSEAPPPYMEVSAESPTSTQSMSSLQSSNPHHKRRSTYHHP
ncbi:hypothetical protein MVEN_00504700 [Mycena venus]|uniref:Uncharacterized protein n=1 Tax=Mycena venus TaxID=2733690 RepID=A0A8H7D4Y5_9AGAR|nr:hypothetical protein MVEN_00504700 [Mycena venus]